MKDGELGRSGTVRENLDPFDTAGGDVALWEALDRAGLKPAIREMEVGAPAFS